jgi:hypothetical protein
LRVERRFPRVSLNVLKLPAFGDHDPKRSELTTPLQKLACELHSIIERKIHFGPGHKS